jgi:ketosteroid isomerase-like protein
MNSSIYFKLKNTFNHKSIRIMIPIISYRWCLYVLMAAISSCHPENKNIQGMKEEILVTEKAFKERVAEWGIRDAFVYFADENAVMVRNNNLIRGKKEIMEYYDRQDLQKIRLMWEPEFVEVARCGDLAYTYGSYTYSSKDSTGHEMISTGIFHTVWKKQEDGSWKFVYD